MKKTGFIILGLIIIISVVLIIVYLPKKDITDLNEAEKNQKFNRVLTEEEQETVNKETFTKETLKKFDGKNGNNSYIAINGIVYDVSNLKEWESGNHKNTTTGIDLTKNFINSDHMNETLSKLKIVGKYEE